MSTIDKVLIGLAAFVVGFIISMIVIFCIFQATPDVLIECTLAGCMSELVITFAIWRLKRIQSKEDKEKKNEK